MPALPSCWTLTEGAAGMDAQVRGLARALGLEPVVKRVRVRLPWRVLPGWLWPSPLAAIAPGGDRLEPPWPDLLITCGRKSAALALGVRKASGGTTRLVHIQDPQLDPARFDVVVAPRHDGIAGPNVIISEAAIHPITPADLEGAADAFRPLFAALPRPLVGVLIGGATQRQGFGPAAVEAIADQLERLTREAGAGLAVTPSRRTGADNIAILERRLSPLPAYLWNMRDPNPYLGLLALSDHLLVTADSVSMVSEAVATAKPVYIIDLPGLSARIRAFHAHIQGLGFTRPFSGRLEAWTYTPPDDTARAAAEIRHRLGWD